LSDKKDPYILSGREFSSVKLVDHNNVFHDSIGIDSAAAIAKDSGLDLVCFGEESSGDLPFCKILDFGKWKYNEDKSKRKQHKEQKKSSKEIRFSLVISDNDIKHKINQAVGFLQKQDDVVLAMHLKGRQRAMFGEAKQKMNDIVNMCLANGKEVSRKEKENAITVRLAPK